VAAVILLDTHVVVWLYLPRLDLLSERAAEIVSTEELAMSPMSVLELQHLHEVGRLTVGTSAVVSSLREQVGLVVIATAFDQVVRHALDQQWTRDPFDRIIVGHTLASGCQLLTADERIRDHVAAAVW
jgi:PIN domain nuclease of toxin-antitoxin system